MNGPPSIRQIVLLTTVVIITGVITCYYLYSINRTLRSWDIAAVLKAQAAAERRKQ